ncbi:MAG: hypothetical protein GY711_05670 [bacterium]|nr:hypothetical protein [bacterium]
MPYYVGDHSFQGSATIFTRNGDTWTESQTITSPNAGPNHAFGSTVASDSDDLMIMEERQDLSVFPEGGPAVHIYRRLGAQWVWSQRIDAPAPGNPNATHFGNSIAIDGDAAYISDNRSGTVHVYEKMGSIWTERAPITAADFHPLQVSPDEISGNILVRGNRLLVTTIGIAQPGHSVFIVERDTNGSWHGVDELFITTLSFPPSMAMTEDTIFVGAPLDAGQAGRVWVYEETGGQWTAVQSITPDPWFNLARFGTSLAYNSGVLAVSAPSWDLPLNATGRVYVFEHDGISWFQAAALDTGQPVSGARLGTSLAVSEDVIAGGAPGALGLGLPGTVSVFDLARPIGTEYGESTTNSTGLGAVLQARGKAVVDTNCLHFQMAQLPPGQFGYALMSTSQGYTPLFGGSQGVLHLALPIVRFSQDILVSDGQGEASFFPDLLALPQNTVIVPGETWSFQYWFRDMNPGVTSNTTNGLAITFETNADPTTQFPATLLQVDEDALQLSVIVTLSQETDQDVIVPYTTSGTAEYNTDWRVEESSPIVVPAGESSFEMTIIVAGDAIQESDETGIIALGPPTGGVLGTASEFTLTIRDDD